jgi:[ribosomal protein S5]-alanine N-acetyltransferase
MTSPIVLVVVPVLDFLWTTPPHSSTKEGGEISRDAMPRASPSIDGMVIQETIHTERLLLRPFTLTDAPRVKALAGDRRIYEKTLLIPNPYEDGVAEAWIATHQTSFYEGSGVVFAICLQSGPPIGAIELHRAGSYNRVELGYWIGAEYWNRGYCTEAAKAILEYGFNVFWCHKISATHFIGNTASGRVMEKIGMKCEGVLRDEVLKDGKYVTVLRYAILNPKEMN